MKTTEMSFIKFRQEVDRIYHSFLEIMSKEGKCRPERMLGIHRPFYEEFIIIIDLTSSEDDVIEKIEKLKKEILEKREKKIQALDNYFTKETVSKKPCRVDKKRISYSKTIEKIDKALRVYQQKNNSNLSIAASVFGFNDTDSESKCKNAERVVSQYILYAEMLIEAAVKGNFVDVMCKPLPKK